MPLLPPLPSLPSLAGPGVSLLGRAGGAGAAVQPLTEEEQQGLLAWAAEQGLSGLEYAAHTLDKPGAAVRGVLSGVTGGPWGGGLYNLIPFSSSLLGLTDDSEKVYGRDLLTQWGVTPQNKPGFFQPDSYMPDWEELGYDLAGLGTEIVLDPLTWVTGPGKSLTTKGVEAAKAARILAKGETVAKEMPEIFAKLTSGGQGPLLGTTPIAMAEEIRQGLRGPIGFQLPFMEHPVVFGAGKEWPAKAIETLYYGKYSPVVPLRYLFSPSAGDVASGAAQLAKDKTYSELKNMMANFYNIKPALEDGFARLEKTFNTNLKGFAKIVGDQEALGAYDDYARYVAEIARNMLAESDNLTLRAEELAPRVATLFGDAPDAMAQTVDMFSQESARLVDGVQMIADHIHTQIQSLGGNIDDLNELFIEHAYRRPSAWAKHVPERERKLFQRTVGPAKARKDVLRDWPEGTLFINRLSRDDVLTATSQYHLKERGLKTEDLKDIIRNWFEESGRTAPATNKLKELQQAYARERYWGPATRREMVRHVGGGGPADTDFLMAWEREMGEKLPDLLKYLSHLNPKVTETGLFGRGYLNDQFDYIVKMSEWMGSLKGLRYFLMGEHVLTNQPKEGYVPLRQAWETPQIRGKAARPALSEIGLHNLARDWYEKNGIELPGLTRQQLLEQVQSQSLTPERAASMYDDAFAAAGEQLKEAVDSLYVPEPTSRILQGYLESMQPRTEVAFAKWWDKTTGALKGGWTIPFPSFHARNYVSSTWNQFAAGGTGNPLRDLANVFKTRLAVTTWLSRGAKNDELAGFAKELAQEMRVLFPDMQGHHMIDIVSAEAGRDVARIPERGLLGIFEPLASREAWTAPYMRGVREAGAEAIERGVTPGIQFAPLKAGENAYEFVEAANRLSGYAYARKYLGMSPGEAIQRVMETDYNYAAASSFSRNIMRRIWPFWGWASNNIPYQLGKLVTEPGGRTAQTIRAFQQFRREGEESGPLPEWMTAGGALRVGGTETQAQIARAFGIPIEDLNTFSTDTVRTGQRILGNLHPVITTPIKLLFGRDLYTGRELKYLKGLTGIPWLDTLIQSSPGQRAIGTTRQMIDERKSIWLRMLNTLTGVKVGTYDLQFWHLTEMKRIVDEFLEKYPETRKYEHIYVPKDKQDQMSDELRLALRTQATLNQMIQEHQAKVKAAG